MKISKWGKGLRTNRILKDGLKENARCADAVCDVGIEKGSVGVECYSPHDENKEIFYCPYKG